MTYNYEMELIESIERKELFDNYELDIIDSINQLPLNGGFTIIDNLEEYENTF